MKPAEFTKCLATIHWSKRTLCVTIGCDTNLATRWERGEAAIPAPIADYLRAMAAAVKLIKVPKGWKRGGPRKVP